MTESLTTILLGLQVLIFVAAILADFARRNEQLVWNYGLQSLAVALVLAILGSREQSPVLLVVVFATIVVKCIIAPMILMRLIKKHDLIFTAPAYLSMPMMIGATLLLVLAVHSTFTPLFADIVLKEGSLMYLSVSAFFVSLFLAVNRRGAFSQIIGILAAENSLVVCAALMNIHTELWLELGILADIFAWTLIGTTFVSIVSKHFNTTDISSMKELAE